MKEKIKGIVFDFKSIGWSFQRVEKELGFSNGSIGKVILGKSGISEFRFLQLEELYKKHFPEKFTISEEVNNLPENDEIENIGFRAEPPKTEIMNKQWFINNAPDRYEAPYKIADFRKLIKESYILSKKESTELIAALDNGLLFKD
jgi:transcriptional regulator with XRE-family HTH domain